MKHRVIPEEHAFSLSELGFRDYYAARFLILNDFLFQGVTLSSTAVEKYIKALLATTGVLSNFHMNETGKIKSLLSRKRLDIWSKMDESYLKLLGKAYLYRYYDKVTKRVALGFHKWQVLAELDYVVNTIESEFKKRSKPGTKTKYQVAVEERDKTLFCENYNFTEISREEMMVRPGPMFVIGIQNGNQIISLDNNGAEFTPTYNGSILQVTSIDINIKRQVPSQ